MGDGEWGWMAVWGFADFGGFLFGGRVRDWWGGGFWGLGRGINYGRGRGGEVWFVDSTRSRVK